MNEQEKAAVKQFVDSVRALVTASEIQKVTSAFIQNRDTTEDMLRGACNECESFANQRLQANIDNVLFLSQRKHLTEACRLLLWEIGTRVHNRTEFPFGINVEQDRLRFD